MAASFQLRLIEGIMRISVVAAVALISFSISAHALTKHETDIQKINLALQTVKITPQQRAQVKKLRDEGAAFHHAGKHGKAERVLEEAKAILHIH
jgi:hypothetical protein